MGRCCCDKCRILKKWLYKKGSQDSLVGFTMGSGALVSGNSSNNVATLNIATSGLNVFGTPNYSQAISPRGEVFKDGDYGCELLFSVSGDDGALGGIIINAIDWNGKPGYLMFGEDKVRMYYLDAGTPSNPLKSDHPDDVAFSFPSRVRITFRHFPAPRTDNSETVYRWTTISVFVNDVLTLRYSCEFEYNSGFSTPYNIQFFANRAADDRTVDTTKQIRFRNIEWRLTDYPRYGCEETAPPAHHEVLNYHTDDCTITLSGAARSELDGTYATYPLPFGGLRTHRPYTFWTGETPASLTVSSPTYPFSGFEILAHAPHPRRNYLTAASGKIRFRLTGSGTADFSIYEPLCKKFGTPLTFDGADGRQDPDFAGAATQQYYDDYFGDGWTLTIDGGLTAPPGDSSS